MGGNGSGFQGVRKVTVEDCLFLSVLRLVKKRAIIAGSRTRGSLQWSYEGCEPHAKISYEANLVDPNAAWVRHTYTVSGTSMDYRVRLVTTQPTYGGRRWWFLCPLARQDGGPPRRVAKLYLPPGGSYFGSRRGLRAHLHVVPGERQIRRALSPTGCEYGDRCGIDQARSEAALGATFRMAAHPQRADLFCRSRNRRDGPGGDVAPPS